MTQKIVLFNYGSSSCRSISSTAFSSSWYDALKKNQISNIFEVEKQYSCRLFLYKIRDFTMIYWFKTFKQNRLSFLDNSLQLWKNSTQAITNFKVLMFFILVLSSMYSWKSRKTWQYKPVCKKLLKPSVGHGWVYEATIDWVDSLDVFISVLQLVTRSWWNGFKDDYTTI